jgi:transposase
VRDLDCGGRHVYLRVPLRRIACKGCGAVKRERIEFLATPAKFTVRFENEIGRRLRETSITAVASLLGLKWDQVRRIEEAYMRRLVDASPFEPPRVIGIDEISVRKRHRYRIVVSDLERKRPIWVGGKDRSAESMALFFAFLEKRAPGAVRGLEIAVQDMWAPFRIALRENAPHVRIVYDKFHVMSHLSDALDTIRKQEYRRASEKDRRFIKGQKYTLLSAREHLTLEKRRSLKLLLSVNSRIHRAYLLRETFGQLWSFTKPELALRFFLRWKDQLRWQRLEPFRKFANMIERHWDGIEAYSRPENKVSLGFVEGVNNKIRVIQRRAYGIRSPEYLRLKVLTAFLDPGVLD